MFLAAGFLAHLVLNVIPELETGPSIPIEVAKARNDVRTTYVQSVGALLLLAGLYFTYKNLALAREEKLTNRFAKAGRVNVRETA